MIEKYKNDMLCINAFSCRSALFLALCTLLLPYSAQAQDLDSFALSPEQLFDATVTSVSKQPQKLWDAPAAIYVLTSDDIKHLGVTTIAEALRSVPGVQVAKTNTSGWAINIRGLNGALANKLLVLIDGREVYDPLFSGVYWDIQDYVIDDIDRIEVIRGPGATLWGSNAVNGVINIITKKAADTQGSRVKLIGGTQENTGSVRYGGKIGDSGYYRVYGKTAFRDESERLDGSDANDEWRVHRTGFRADWDKDEANSFNLQGDYYYNEVGNFTTVATFSSPYASIINDEILARGANILGTWSHAFSSDERLDVKSYVNYTEREQYLLVNKRVTFDTDAQYQMAQQGAHKVIIGGKYRYSRDDLDFSPQVTASEEERVDNTFSGFIHDKITLSPEKWYLTLGSKFEHNDYNGFEVQPSARLQWHPTDSQMVWSAVSYAVRTPSRLEHDLRIIASTGEIGGALVSADIVSNPSFDSEQLTAYELGYRNQITSDITLDVATFFNEYRDLMSITKGTVTTGTNPTRTVVPFTFANDTEAYTYGGEILLDWQATDRWNLSTSYSFLDINVKGPSEADEKLSPQGQFNLHSHYNVTDTVSLDNMLYYVSALPGYDVEGYWRFDTRIGWEATDNIELSLVGQNLFDDKHREFSSPTALGATTVDRAVYGSVTWRF